MFIPPPSARDIDCMRAVFVCAVLGFVCVCLAALIVPQERDNQEVRP